AFYFDLLQYVPSRNSKAVESAPGVRKTPLFYGWSGLFDDTCLENSHLKICFDDFWGGTPSSLYNKTFSPTHDFIYDTAGAGLQFALRASEPVNLCPGKTASWGVVWNPTQAGCEHCFKHPSDAS